MISVSRGASVGARRRADARGTRGEAPLPRLRSIVGRAALDAFDTSEAAAAAEKQGYRRAVGAAG
jgi:hypothetical protein